MDGNGASYSIYPGLPFIDQTPKPDGSIEGIVIWSTKSGPVVVEVSPPHDGRTPRQKMVGEVLELIGVYSESADMGLLERNLTQVGHPYEARSLIEQIGGIPRDIQDQAYRVINQYAEQGAFLPKPPEPKRKFDDRFIAPTFPRHPGGVRNRAIFDPRENSC
ncbi:hypothetical protein HYU14_07545 [Candidatus Woesearchaeota archaeon]|nr:hypothetical protein [Candidatus Woesearchaeota archaeon]